MSEWLLIFLVPVAAVLFRIRGGWLGLPSTTLGRAVWAVGVTLGCVIATFNWWLLALAPLLFLGCVLPWWGSIDLGRNEGSYWADVAIQIGRGLLWVLPAIPLLGWQYGWWAVATAVAGLLCPLAYEIGWRTPSNVRGFTRGSEVGEVLFGALIGAGIAITIVGG